MADWRPYGYAGKPGTCRWYGSKLAYKRVSASREQENDPTYRTEGTSLGLSGQWATVRASKPGGYQDGLFCGLRCDYLRAVRQFRGS